MYPTVYQVLYIKYQVVSGIPEPSTQLMNSISRKKLTAFLKLTASTGKEEEQFQLLRLSRIGCCFFRGVLWLPCLPGTEAGRLWKLPLVKWRKIDVDHLCIVCFVLSACCRPVGAPPKLVALCCWWTDVQGQSEMVSNRGILRICYVRHRHSHDPVAQPVEFASEWLPNAEKPLRPTSCFNPSCSSKVNVVTFFFPFPDANNLIFFSWCSFRGQCCFLLVVGLWWLVPGSRCDLTEGTFKTQNHRHPKIAATSTSWKNVLPRDTGGWVLGVLVCGEWCHEEVKKHGSM